MEFIDLRIDGHLATVTINRPEVRNALHPAALFELSEAFDHIEQDDDVWVAILTGAGEQAFCAGRDLKRLAQTSHDEQARLADEKLLAASTRLTDRFYFPKPIIARLNGSAYGGGLELALACDIIVAVDHARVGLPEPKRGLIAMAGGVHRLSRQIPLKPAMAFLLTGRDMSAATGMELGLINDLVSRDDLDAVVQSYVDDILACAPLAVRATKECVMRGLDYPLAEAATREYDSENKRLLSDDAKEGPRAFAEKRAPVWKGK
jgi:enoyl-CoA hydratase/carnithine racemase